MIFQAAVTFAIVISSVLLFVVGQETSTPGPKVPQCRGVDIKYTEDKMMNLMECVNATGANSAREIPVEKLPCFIKCVLNCHGLIDESGLPHKENIMNSIDKSMPDDVKEDLKAGFAKCLDDYGKNIDPKDQTCMAFGPLSECFHMTYVTLCKTSLLPF